ncbi:MAG: ribonuclease HII [Chloroflexi bacterium RBG_16_54_18]|nr:MAG: ribonuclease HII [Chloroflexi bacterium RBG_16_54_18]
MHRQRKKTFPFTPDFSFESQLWGKGIRFIAGVDEAGRGALAGPVSAGALVLPPDPEIQHHLKGMHDSKKHTRGQREEFAGKIRELALACAVGYASAAEIDRLGILPATRLAIQNALSQLGLEPDHLLVDYIALPGCNIPQISIVKGDESSLSIAGASILAKVARDDLMRQLDRLYPEYGFAAHKGYGTQAHRAMLSRLGPCPVHRLSFKFRTVDI